MNTKFIDLGLPSGTLWADRNLGAEKPEDYGDYFRFGETIPFTEDSPDYITKPFGKDISSTIYDAAMSYNINSCIPNKVISIKDVDIINDKLIRRIWINNI